MTNVVTSQEHDLAAGGVFARVSRVTLAKMIGFFVIVVLASAFLVPRGVELAWLRAKSGQALGPLRLYLEQHLLRQRIRKTKGYKIPGAFALYVRQVTARMNSRTQRVGLGDLHTRSA